jgi:hypothetical protein
MEEVFPVASGVVLGLALAHLIRGRLRVWALSGFSVLLGATASWISGELTVSRIYLLIDIAQVLAAGAMTWILAARWRRLASAAPRGDV